MLKEVLIIDDSADIVEVLKDFLDIYGISASRIHATLDPFEGLEIFRKNKDSISLVICDYYMPKSNGPELCDILKKNKPELNVILQTGDSNIKLEQLRNVDHVLHKPYDYDKFSELIDAIDFNKPKTEYTRIEPRKIQGKYDIAVLRLSDYGPYIHGTLFNQSEHGCGMVVTSANGIKKDDEFEVMLGHYTKDTNQFEMRQAVKVKIAWIKVVTIDTYRLGLQFLE